MEIGFFSAVFKKFGNFTCPNPHPICEFQVRFPLLWSKTCPGSSSREGNLSRVIGIVLMSPLHMAVSKPLLTEFGRLIRELCDTFDVLYKAGHDYMVEVQYPCHFVAF